MCLAMSLRQIGQFVVKGNCGISHLLRTPTTTVIFNDKYIKLSIYCVARLCHTQSVVSQNVTLANGRNMIKKKIDDLVTKYEQITGMDEVRIAQNRVIEAQDKFVLAQEKRRDLVKELTAIQEKLKAVYAELDGTTRGEERYLSLVTKEHNLLKDERRLASLVSLSEREERECFTFLSSSVKESHEKERAQAERTKYWSVIGSILGTVIGVVGSSINNELKMRELRKLVMESTTYSRESAQADNMAAAILTRHEEQLGQIIGEMRTISKTHQLPDGVGEGSALSQLLFLDHARGSTSVEAMLEQQRRETRLMLGIVAIVIPIIVVCMNRIM